MAMDVIDYFIHGYDMQFVDIELDPGEAAMGEAGSMMYMEDGITMDTVFGDASAQQSGLFGKLVGAGGGGFMMFFTRDRDRLRRAMVAEGLQEMHFDFDFSGSIVHLRA